jgi:hypothetical protein
MIESNLLGQVASGLRPEMISTIRDYDPDKPNMPITLAWDETQRHVRCTRGRIQEPEGSW